MPTHVAVVDPLPMYQQGVIAVLSAIGYAVDVPADVVTWIRHTETGPVLLTLAAEPDWSLLDQLAVAASDHPVIALVPDGSPGAGVRAVRSGARSVLPRAAGPSVLRRTVEATIDGQAVLPAAVVAALTSAASIVDPAGSPVSATKLAWLRLLADGATVAQVARSSGYSERAMFRMLQTLYRELGVRTRVQAIVHAEQQGWLRTPDSL